MEEIPLTNDKCALVDDADVKFLSGFKWHINRSSNTDYVVTRLNRSTVGMHQLLLSAPKGLVIDHRDGDGTNNQRSNLRICTFQENMQNQRQHRDSTSPYKGIWRSGALWAVQIWNGRKSNYVGSFRDPKEAAAVYDFCAIQVFGPFAKTNFPSEARP